MRQCKSGLTIANRGLGFIGQFDPSIASIDAVTRQAKQHGRRVLNVDVEIGNRLDQRRGMIAEAAIVQRQHAGHVAQFEVEHGLVPP